MEFNICLMSLALLLILAEAARGPLCLHCDSVNSPHECATVKECWPWESCFTEHFLYTNGTQAFTFGCRVTQQCEQLSVSPKKRFDLRLCSECCTGDICNNNVCTNGTAPPSGIPCLSCSSAPSTSSCSQMTYCKDGEVCYAEKSTSSASQSFNMGCLKKEVCELFDEEIIGKRSLRAVGNSLCHECCEKPGCNYDACAAHQASSTTVPPSTAGSTSALPAPRDCWDLRSVYNITEDGIYQVLSPSGSYVNHRCDMTTDGGGWIVFQKRYKGSVNFDQPYTKYQTGFGVLSDEFWMGNDLLHEFTKDNNQKLRVDICDWGSAKRFAVYDFFSVGPPSDSYRLMVASYHGDAGDSLITGSGGNQFHNNRCFSTSDVDNDISTRHCAREFRSGWWFGDCFSANLNGNYQFAGPVTAGAGLQWRLWREKYSFKGTEMKFRPRSATPTSHEPFHCPVH